MIRVYDAWIVDHKVRQGWQQIARAHDVVKSRVTISLCASEVWTARMCNSIVCDDKRERQIRKDRVRRGHNSVTVHIASHVEVAAD